MNSISFIDSKAAPVVTTLPNSGTDPVTSIAQNTLVDIASHHGVSWTCIQMLQNNAGGKRYIYKYDGTNTAPFPAVEPGKEFTATFKPILGFDKQDEMFIVPDTEGLKANWDEHRKANPHQYELRVFVSPGILEHKAYIEAWFEHDVVVSSDKEFLHDLWNHALPTLTLMKEDYPAYVRAKAYIVSKLKPRLARLESLCNESSLDRLEQWRCDRLKPHQMGLAAMLSAIVDSVSSGYALETFYNDTVINGGYINDSWETYLKNQFNEEPHLLHYYFKDLMASVVEDEKEENTKANLIQLLLFLDGTEIGRRALVTNLHRRFANCSDADVEYLKPWIKRLMQTADYQEDKEVFVARIIYLIVRKPLYPAYTRYQFEQALKRVETKEHSCETDLDTLYITEQKKVLQFEYKTEDFYRLKSVVFAEVFQWLFYKLEKTKLWEHRHTLSLVCRILLRDKYQLDLAINSKSLISRSHAQGLDPEAFLAEIAEQIEAVDARINVNRNDVLDWAEITQLIYECREIVSNLKLIEK